MPLVSGKNMVTRNSPNRQTPEKTKMLPWMPMIFVTSGKNFGTMKLTMHKSVKQRVAQKFFEFSGIISAIIMPAGLRMALKTINE